MSKYPGLAILVLSVMIQPPLSARITSDGDLKNATFYTAFDGCAAVYVRGVTMERAQDEFLPKFRPEVASAFPKVRVQADRAARIITASTTLADGSRHVERMQHISGYGCVGLKEGGPHSSLKPSRPPSRAPEAMLKARASRLQATIALAAVLKEEIAEQRTIGLVVLEDGHLLAEAYAPGYDATSIWVTASVSKSITATLAGRLIQKGLMTVDQPVPLRAMREAGGYIPAIRVTDMLRQSSGLNCPDDDDGAEQDPKGLVAHYIAGGSYAYPATAHFYRHSCNHSLLDAAMGEVATAAGLDKRTLVQDLVFTPLGMAHSDKQFADPVGNLFGGAGYAASARDLARLGQLYLQRGLWDGKQLLPTWWVNYVTLPTSIPERGNPSPRFRDGANCLDYGASFWRVAVSDPSCDRWPSLPRDAFMMAGWQGQYVIIIPSRSMVIVRLGYEPDPDALDIEKSNKIDHLMERILSAVPTER